MDPEKEKTVRVWLYGLIPMTRRAFLLIQSIVLVLLLGFLAFGVVVMIQEGRMLPELREIPGKAPPTWGLQQIIIARSLLGRLD